MKKYRNEWKYCCNNYELKLLESRLKDVLKYDPHTGRDGKYYVHSLYFDDYKDMCAKKTELGLYKRFKYRIRYYNNNPSQVTLEKKEKLYGRCYKRSVVLTIEQYNQILSGNVQDLFWNTKKQLLKEFCVDLMNRNFRPKLIVDYERIAFVEPISNIRITMDTNISVSYEFDKFLEGNYILFPLQDREYHVLEVKFDDILPGYIRNIICSHGFVQTSFSKYYIGRKKMESVIKWI